MIIVHLSGLPYVSLTRLVQAVCIWAATKGEMKQEKSCKAMLWPPFSNKLDLFLYVVMRWIRSDAFYISACAHSLDFLFFFSLGKPRQRHLVTCLFNCPSVQLPTIVGSPNQHLAPTDTSRDVSIHICAN